jgi:putative FmdB family regulatory protein
MPIYEYACQNCGKRSQALLRTFDAPDPGCPHCGQAQLRRLVSSFATQRSEESDFGSDFDEGMDRAEHDLGDDFDAGGFGGPDDDF